MKVHGYIRARREKAPKDSRHHPTGYMYVYYYRVVDAQGNVIWSDNTANWQKMYDQCFEKVSIINESQRLGARWPRFGYALKEVCY